MAVSAIIVLANVSEISALYLFQLLGLDALADSLLARVLLGSSFIITMTWISIRGIVISERMQMIIMFIQFAVLIVASVIALVKVGLDRAGPQAIDPEWSWLWPGGLDQSQIAAAVILCIFIYWGWDACLAVNEETRDQRRPRVARPCSPASSWSRPTSWSPTPSSRSPGSATPASASGTTPTTRTC